MTLPHVTHVPSSWFLTTLTASSTCRSTGLLHPAAGHGVHRVPDGRHRCHVVVPRCPTLQSVPLHCQRLLRHRSTLPPCPCMTCVRPRGTSRRSSDKESVVAACRCQLDAPEALLGFPLCRRASPRARSSSHPSSPDHPPEGGCLGRRTSTPTLPKECDLDRRKARPPRRPPAECDSAVRARTRWWSIDCVEVGLDCPVVAGAPRRGRSSSRPVPDRCVSTPACCFAHLSPRFARRRPKAATGSAPRQAHPSRPEGRLVTPCGAPLVVTASALAAAVLRFAHPLPQGPSGPVPGIRRAARPEGPHAPHTGCPVGQNWPVCGWSRVCDALAWAPPGSWRPCRRERAASAPLRERLTPHTLALHTFLHGSAHVRGTRSCGLALNMAPASRPDRGRTAGPSRLNTPARQPRLRAACLPKGAPRVMSSACRVLPSAPRASSLDVGTSRELHRRRAGRVGASATRSPRGTGAFAPTLPACSEEHLRPRRPVSRHVCASVCSHGVEWLVSRMLR
jgi:hypothetical protein